MGNVTWEVAKPSPDPFAAVVGDFSEYVVHLCTVSDASDPEIAETFVEFFRQAFESALTVENLEARRVLIEIDTVYAMLTVVVTDQVRSHDERTVFKLSMKDWDVGVADDEEVDDGAREAVFEGVMNHFEGAIRAAVGDTRLSSVEAQLRALGFRLWIFDHDEEEAGATLKELPLAGD
jgi:hypothetical protein